MTAQGSTDLRNYAVADLKADDGMPEINDTVAKLPRRIVETRTQRRDKKFR